MSSKITKTTWKKYGLFCLIGALILPLGSCIDDKATHANTTSISILNSSKSSQQTLSRLNIVKRRGSLVCGIGGELPGFSYVDSNGSYAGIDVDICRAIAAALFDDPRKVIFRQLSTEERFDVLKSGEIDLLSRNTTQTLSRDTDGDLDFTPPIFYDNQGIMVNRASKISNLNTIADLKDKSICVAEKTTSYDNLTEYMNLRKIKYTPLTSVDRDSLYSSYERNLCQAITGDISQLVARRTMFANPQEHQILPQIISQEPLAPVVRHQDSQWFDTVEWVTFALIEAEELGIDSENINSYKKSKDSYVKHFLGREGDVGIKMGLSNDFAARIIKHVGNYGEIYDRNIGRPFGVARGQNALWKNGGLMYSPPFD